VLLGGGLLPLKSQVGDSPLVLQYIKWLRMSNTINEMRLK
jgi:hypothetical protein